MPLDLARLRALRALAEERNASFVDDLQPFLREDNTCCRLPSKRSEPDVSVTTACTCLMAAILTGRLSRLYKSAGKPGPKSAAKEAFKIIVEASWVTAGLPEDNNFTRMLVLRTAGILRLAEVITDKDLGELKHAGKTIPEIAREMLSNIPASFEVDTFGSKAAIAYWFLDAIDSLGIPASEDQATSVVNWACVEFRRQFSYVVANYDAMLDPVAMVMAACVVKRLQKWRALGKLTKSAYENLPPAPELRHSVLQLFLFQGKSGIWPKYFPLFNYPADGTSNYCFTFEFLEAIVTEFADSESRLFGTDSVLCGLELAINWCNQNRFQFLHEGSAFYGWNSGTQIKLLRAGIPESWATAAIHMFLAKVRDGLSEAIDESVVAAWAKPRDPEEWDNLIDAPLTIRDLKTTLKDVLESQILKNIKAHPEYPRSLYRGKPIEGRRSAVLFGPPRTSKTTVVRALADRLKWPYVEITPSDFVGKGMEQIHARTTEIFGDLADLAGVVVLFDEMDALAAKRDGTTQLDVVRQLLTTGMLPKLADLFRRKQIVYFMNTNHRKGIDPAIMRAGRFDMLLHVVPPTWKDKLDGLRFFYDAKEAELKKAKILLQDFTKDREKQAAILDRFTFSEMKSFLEHVQISRDGKQLSGKLTAWNKDGFLRLVEEWGSKFIVLKEGSSELEEFNEDQGASSLQ
jgi:hypothetical protein